MMIKRQFIKLSISIIIILISKSIHAGQKTLKKLLSKTKIMIDPIFYKHHISSNHPETPERIKYIENAINETNLITLKNTINHKKNVKKWINEIHTEKHVESIQNNDPIAHKVAEAAVKACLTSIDDIFDKKTRNVFCATRPPGHHALNTGKEEGFCYYNNVAISAKYIQKKYNLKKILIIDWDYHHGNSTEFFFYDDPSVLFFSTHDQFAYPGTGSPERKGSGPGFGYNINVHLPCGANDKDIIEKFTKVLIPAAKKFEPDFIIISAGFDSRKDDLLGCFKISDKGFFLLTNIVLKIAEEYCSGRLISVLEGGYNLEGNAKATISHIKALSQF